jgi:biotin carboxyl carrier protein
MRHTFTYAGQPVSVDLTPSADGTLRATIDGRTYAVQVARAPDGALLLTVDGVRHTAWVETIGVDRVVAVGGEVYTLHPPETPSARGRGAAGGDLTAHMPGVVRAVLVEVGAEVARGAPLLVLEAMKMEMRITAPHDGTVTAIAVTAGDVVERGQRLVVIA